MILLFMSRPRKKRCIFFNPNVVYFKPQGIPMRFLKEVSLEIDELEALRLCDYKKMDQIDAGKKMKISQSTLQRTLTSARQKTAQALITGKAIKVFQ